MSQFARLIVLSSSVFAAAAPAIALADEASDCSSGDGTLLSGVVIVKPRFVDGKPLRGIPLTHTHILIKGDTDGETYDVAVDDVFAAGYSVQESDVPSPLNSIGVGDHVEACGQPYSGGMHFVHTNCGDTPTQQDPNGWLKVIDASGTVGPNLEDSQKYCYLWAKNNSSRGRPSHAKPPQNM